VCAYVALFWYHRPEDVTLYGDFATGYIVTPTLPPDAAPARRRRAAPQPDHDDLRARVARRGTDQNAARADNIALKSGVNG
jgi:predicted RNase H-like nuclease